jgi:DNA-binding CsgD family transcriptional regulator
MNYARKAILPYPSMRAVTIGDEPEMFARLRAMIGTSVDLTNVASEEDLDDRATGLTLFLSSADVPWSRVRRFATRGTQVLLIVTQVTEEDEQRALESEAIGYLGLDVAPSALIRAIQGAFEGQPVFRRRALGRWLLRDLVRRRRVERLGRLTQRQQQIASLLTTGAADKEIAATLGIAVATVQKHVSSLLRVIGATNRAAAVWLILGGAEIADRF